MDTKAAFEKWVKTVMHDTDDFHQEWGMYTNLNVRIRWEAWQASRQAIEIPSSQLKKYQWLDGSFNNKRYETEVRLALTDLLVEAKS